MKRGRVLLVLVTLIAVAGMSFAPGVMADPTTDDPITDHLDTGDFDELETAPVLVTNGTFETASQDLAEGTSHTAIAGYEDDDGDWVPDGDVPDGGQLEVNTTWDEDDGSNANHYTFNPAHIDDDGLQEFPAGHDEASDWLNSSTHVWNQETNSANVSVSETTVASGVDAIRFDTGTSGDTVSSDGSIVFEASYNGTDSQDGDSDLGLDSDESKRVLIVAGDLDTLETNAELQIRIYDESGDYKEVRANDSENRFGSNPVFANSTGSFFYQIKLNKLSTTGGGSWDNIENVTVRTVSSGGTSNADVDVTISTLDLRRKAKLDLGEMRATTNDDGNDPDSDSDYDEIQTIYNASGDVSIYSMETLDSEFDDAVVNDLSYPFHYLSSGNDRQGQEGNYAFQWEEPSNPSFTDTLNLTVSQKLPSAIDVSYSNTETRVHQKWPESRYLTFESASGVADSTNLSEAGFGSDSSSLGSQETIITVDSSTDAGERIVVHWDIQMTSDERNSTEVDADDDGGAVPPPEDTGGDGILGFGTAGDIAALLGTIGAFLVGIPQRIWRGIAG